MTAGRGVAGLRRLEECLLRRLFFSFDAHRATLQLKTTFNHLLGRVEPMDLISLRIQRKTGIVK